MRANLIYLIWRKIIRICDILTFLAAFILGILKYMEVIEITWMKVLSPMCIYFLIALPIGFVIKIFKIREDRKEGKIESQDKKGDGLYL